MQDHLSFTPIHALLEKRDSSDWASYWRASGKDNNHFMRFYPAYIASLMEKIKTSGAKRIFIIHQDRAFFLAAFLATLQLGIPVVFPPSDAPGLLKDVFEFGDGLLTDQEDLSSFAPLFISMGEVEVDIHTRVRFERLNPLEALITFYTSGSTGTPKAIQKTLKHLEEEIGMLEETWRAQDKETTFLSTVPHQHIYGLLFSLLWPVCAGYPIRSHTFSYWEDVLREGDKEIYVVSSPSHLSRYPSFMEEREKPKIKAIFSSGGPLPFESVQETQIYLGTLPIEVYGSTETGGIAYRQQGGRKELWTKFRNVELLIGDEGKLCVKSPYLPHGAPYQTEDRVTLESEDCFHLLGRVDRIVKVEGKRVCLVEVERRLQDLEDIQEAAVLLLDTLNRDELGAVLVLSAEGQEKLASLGKAKFVRGIRKRLSPYFEAVTLPRKWRFVSELPLNQQGKRSTLLLKDSFVESP
jgi:acyl-coenzyme A synthetase/AMP-(fatty) acid ligase